MTKHPKILLAYEYDIWTVFGIREPIYIDISLKQNSHVLISGMSGSGKSYLTIELFARLCKYNNKNRKFYFCDFKCEDDFQFLRECSRYYSYERTIEALEEVYAIMNARQSGKDKSRRYI